MELATCIIYGRNFLRADGILRYVLDRDVPNPAGTGIDTELGAQVYVWHEITLVIIIIWSGEKFVL